MTAVTTKWENSKSLNVYILYDRTGSMMTKEVEAVSSINAYVKALESDVVVTIVAFDSNDPNQIVRDHVPVSQYKNVTVDEVKARGMTPLYDSTGWIVDRILSDNPERAVLVIQTDGEDNVSCRYNATSIKGKLETLTARGYEVIYLGSEFKDVNVIAKDTGVLWSKTINRTVGNYGAVASTLAMKTRAYAATGAAMSFSKEEKAKLGDNT